MLRLPLHHPEPFAATLGVMLYPETTESGRRKARAFAAQHLAEPLREAMEDGHSPSYETLVLLATNCGEQLDDLETRFQQGMWVGDLVKALYTLSCSHPKLASWNNAASILERAAGRRSGSRSAFHVARKRLLTVAHLWGAWSIRDGKFNPIPEIGYTGWDVFQYFLAESEVLRDWGQNWRPKRAKAEPPLPAEVYAVPGDWHPPARQEGWPPVGIAPYLELPAHLLEGLKPAGRPRKT